MQREDPASGWRILDDINVTYGQAEGEIVVGGVYLRIFIDNPTWALRRPVEFMRDLFDLCINLPSKENTDVISEFKFRHKS